MAAALPLNCWIYQRWIGKPFPRALRRCFRRTWTKLMRWRRPRLVGDYGALRSPRMSSPPFGAPSASKFGEQ